MSDHKFIIEAEINKIKQEAEEKANKIKQAQIKIENDKIKSCQNLTEKLRHTVQNPKHAFLNKSFALHYVEPANSDNYFFSTKCAELDQFMKTANYSGKKVKINIILNDKLNKYSDVDTVQINIKGNNVVYKLYNSDENVAKKLFTSKTASGTWL